MKTKMRQVTVVILLITTLLMMGCVSESSSGTQTYNAGDAIENAKILREQKIEEAKSTYKEDIDRHYANGLYTADLDEIRKEFNEAYIKYMKENIKKYFDDPVIVKVEPIFYNADLKEFKEKNMTFEDIKDAPEKHLREVMVQSFMFYTNEELKINDNYPDEVSYEEDERIIFNNIQDYFNNLREEYLMAGVKKPTFVFSIHDPKVLKKHSFEELRKEDNLIVFLNQYEKLLVFRNASIADFKSDRFNTNASFYTYQKKGKLEKKYSQKIIPLWQGKYAPREDYNLIFSGNADSSNYYNVKAQKLFGDRINKIIKEVGAEDRIVQYTVPRANGIYGDVAYDFGNMSEEEELQYLRKGYPEDYDTSFIFLLEPGEEVSDEDYDLLAKVVNKTGDIVADKEELKHEMFGFFYELPKRDHPIIVDLFKKDMITYKYYSNSSNMTELYETMYKTHEETDGFHYLDLYGKKKDFVLKINGKVEKGWELKGKRRSSVY